MTKRHPLFSLAALLPVILGGLPAHGEDFYQTRLRAGSEALRGGKPLDAIEELRIACFGFLDQPPYLSEGLSRLALAQQAAGRTADVDATLTRIVEVERRFASFGKAKLEPDVREQVVELLRKHVRPETLQAVPSLAGLVPTEEQRIAKLAGKEKTRALEAMATKEPAGIGWPLALARDAASRNDHKATIAWATKALNLEPENGDGLAMRGRAHVARKEWPAAVTDLSALKESRLRAEPALNADLFVAHASQKNWSVAGGYAKAIPDELKTRPDVAALLKKLPAEAEAPAAAAPEAVPVPAAPATAPTPAAGRQPVAPAAEKAPSGPTAVETIASAKKLIADRNLAEAQKLLTLGLQKFPANRDVRKALLEASVLSRDWATAAAQLRFVEPLHEGEEPTMFYAAVAQFETGAVEAARVLMRRARTKVAGSAFVDYYVKKVLGGT